MKLLLDQDVYALTERFLVSLGHDVVTAADLGLARTTDLEILSTAESEQRVLVTFDKDFGGLVFVANAGAGVVFLRASPSNLPAVHKELERVLNRYQEADLRQAFVVVEPGRHRFRKLPRPVPLEK